MFTGNFVRASLGRHVCWVVVVGMSPNRR